ncbi:hypothetical protein [Streptomyces sp. NPDC088246]|uniref:hypothetical protein n=1 Tax=Streptomyces sp. NPDC088246 TaxID=3365842 RepID=UPI00382D8852
MTLQISATNPEHPALLLELPPEKVERHIHRRYERKPEHFLAFVGIAAALIRHRRLVAREAG